MRVASPDPSCWCGCSSHIFDPSTWRPQNHDICQQKKPVRAPGFLLKSTFSLEKFSLYFSLGGHFSPRNSIFFFFLLEKQKRVKDPKTHWEVGLSQALSPAGGSSPTAAFWRGYSQLCRRDITALQTSPHPPQMELSLPFLLEEIKLRWPLDILDHN